MSELTARQEDDLLEQEREKEIEDRADKADHDFEMEKDRRLEEQANE